MQTQVISDFWGHFEALRANHRKLNKTERSEQLSNLVAACNTGNREIDAGRQELLKFMASHLGLDLPVLPGLPVPEFCVPKGTLPQISSQGLPGVSLVTCCMNREANLLKALDSWLACPDICEIVIVDWSSDTPVRKALETKGVADPRIRIIRVEGEPHWILSYAFNVGFRAASCSRILKADADIVLSPDFFEKNPLVRGSFIAGNWRNAPEDQAHINGFFYVNKADLAAIGGFNEYITTYGWDDDDLYDRLDKLGLSRIDVGTSTIRHLQHSDEERLGRSSDQSEQDRSALYALRSEPMFLIRQNRFLANVMPYWNERKTLLPFDVLKRDTSGATLQHKGWIPHPVPENIEADARFYATRELAAWRLGERTFSLQEDELMRLLEKPLSELGRIDVELALGNDPDAVRHGSGYLVATVSKEWLREDPRADTVLLLLSEQAQKSGLALILSGTFETWPEGTPNLVMALPFIPSWLNIGTIDPIGIHDLGQPIERAAGQHFGLTLDDKAVETLIAPKRPAPAAVSSRPRIYVDGQHGLGNRLRAIGSAAAIAEKTGRELVIVWQPDSHCDCHFGDLFDYDGAVIAESFVQEAAGSSYRVYNYMEVEEGAEKDALVDTAGDTALYARSAYVLNSPLSSWEDENRFLRSLKPVDAVREMVVGVRTPNDVSAHVRMAGGKAYEHLPYEQSAGNWTEEGHAAIAHWREKSHFSNFFARLDALTAEGRAERIFVAADLPETYAEFRAAYGDRVAMLERAVYDRSAEQLRYALADALLLGSAPLLLGSSWSSFSELAMRLSPRKMEIEMSGKDF